MLGRSELFLRGREFADKAPVFEGRARICRQDAAILRLLDKDIYSEQKVSISLGPMKACEIYFSQAFTAHGLPIQS